MTHRTYLAAAVGELLSVAPGAGHVVRELRGSQVVLAFVTKQTRHPRMRWVAMLEPRIVLLLVQGRLYIKRHLRDLGRSHFLINTVSLGSEYDSCPEQKTSANQDDQLITSNLLYSDGHYFAAATALMCESGIGDFPKAT